MCKAPKPPAIQAPDKPEYLRNRVLDRAYGGAGTIQSLREGRSALRNDLSTGNSLAIRPPTVTPPNRIPPGPGPSPYRGQGLPGIRSRGRGAEFFIP